MTIVMTIVMIIVMIIVMMISANYIDTVVRETIFISLKFHRIIDNVIINFYYSYL